MILTKNKTSIEEKAQMVTKYSKLVAHVAAVHVAMKMISLFLKSLMIFIA